MTSSTGRGSNATRLARFTLTLTLSLKGEGRRSKACDEEFALEEDFLR
jgi:hypothetical protein